VQQASFKTLSSHTKHGYNLNIGAPLRSWLNDNPRIRLSGSWQHFEVFCMNISISIPEEIAMQLEKRAAESGQSVQAYAARIVVDNVTKPTIDEILSPIRADFAKTGMSEDEITDFLSGQLQAHRREKKAKHV
jgi:hypothetical protein